MSSIVPNLRVAELILDEIRMQNPSSSRNAFDALVNSSLSLSGSYSWLLRFLFRLSDRLHPISFCARDYSRNSNAALSSAMRFCGIAFLSNKYVRMVYFSREIYRWPCILLSKLQTAPPIFRRDQYCSFSKSTHSPTRKIQNHIYHVPPALKAKVYEFPVIRVTAWRVD